MKILQRVRLSVVLVTAVLFSWPAAAEIYKCKSSHGKLVFSDKPCGGNAETVTLKKGTTYTKSDDTEQWQAVILSNSTRKLERQLESRQDNIKSYRRTMDKKLDELRYQKKLATNNMAGATWEKSLSDEMEVVSDKYNSMIAYEMKEIEALRTQLASK